MVMILRTSSILPFYWMSVVESDLPFAIRSVQRERVIDPMRFLGGHRHPGHHELDPMASRRIDHKDLPVEIQKHIQRQVISSTHAHKLSDYDNCGNRQALRSPYLTQFCDRCHARAILRMPASRGPRLEQPLALP